MGRKPHLIHVAVLLAALISTTCLRANADPEAPAAEGAAPAAPGGAAPGGAPGAAPGGGAPGAAPGGAPGAAPGGAPEAAPGGAPPGSIDISKEGAAPGSDASQAMCKAWTQACTSPQPTTIVVPKANFTLSALNLTGPCTSPVTIEIAGNFLAPVEPEKCKVSNHPDPTWVYIERVVGLTITAKEGGGVFDGNGEAGWKQNDCNKTKSCSQLPYNFRFFDMNNSVIRGISSMDSKQFHMNIINCYNLTLEKVNVQSPKDSPNTDGIHMGRCGDIKIIDTTIGVGDDCISVGDGTKNLSVTGVTCGPGHGISIGSLGRYPNEEPVSGVTVTNATFKGAENGIRIKSWMNSTPCSVSDSTFTDITVDNVTNPILVDQAYCPFAKCDTSAPSKVKLSNISFKNVKGTSASPHAIKLVCSSGTPCDNVQLEDIDLKYTGPLGPVVSECCNVKPVVKGKVSPEACAQSASEVAPSAATAGAPTAAAGDAPTAAAGGAPTAAAGGAPTAAAGGAPA